VKKMNTSSSFLSFSKRKVKKDCSSLSITPRKFREKGSSLPPFSPVDRGGAEEEERITSCRAGRAGPKRKKGGEKEEGRSFLPLYISEGRMEGKKRR